MAQRTDQAAAERIRHRYTQKDTDNYKRISLLIDEEVKTFNSISDSINVLNKRILSLEKSGDVSDIKLANKLREIKKQSEAEYIKYSESIESGIIAENVSKKFSDSQLSAATAGIESIKAGIEKTLVEAALPKQTDEMRSIQTMVKKRFTHNEIKRSFAKKNLNYFSEIAKADQIANTKNLAI